VKWEITQQRTIEYLKSILNRSSVAYYRKQAYQIRKFLIYLHFDWANNIKLPAEPERTPKRLSREDIQKALQHFEGHQYFNQIRALILLGATSGMRAEEMYQLNIDDIDLNQRLVCINHNPEKGQTTKTHKSRISFFNEETQESLFEYIVFFNNGNNLKRLFSKSHIKKVFRDAPIQVKDLRKFFSQEWDRRGGPTSIKKILMGHSLKGDVDLMHYNCQSEVDLKKIYDKVSINIL
jgi:integrase/recombinase XerD